jgi:hypothetical protein
VAKDIIEDLEQKLKIDEHGLEIELRDHPDSFYKVAAELSLAISLRDEAKQKLDETESRVDIEIRAEAARLGEKVTEKEVLSRVKTDKAFTDATDRFFELKARAAKISALKEAFEQKSYALSKLTDLYIANYYSQQDKLENNYSAQVKTIRAEQVKKQLADRRKREQL